MSFWQFLKSRIGRKILMAFSGIGLSVFLLFHVSGNLLILVNPEGFNEYSYALTSNTLLLLTAEAILLAIFLLHIYMAFYLTKKNREARPVSYYQLQGTGSSRRSLFSYNMMISGFVLLVFVIFHLWHFKFGKFEEIPSTVQEGTEMRDLAASVIQDFQEPLYVALYLGAMLFLGGHLIHGVRSLFSTLGIERPRYAGIIKGVSYLYVAGVVGGFMLIPLWIYFMGVSS